MEIDISNKVKRAAVICAGVVVLLTAAVSTGVWYWQQNVNYIPVREAQIKGAYVNAAVQAPGTIEEILVADGDTVEAGQAVARIKVKISPEQIQELEKAVAAAQKHYQEVLVQPTVIPAGSSVPVVSSGADVSAAQAAYDRAQLNKNRMDSLFAIGAVSAVQRDKANAAFEAANAALQSARAAGSYTQAAPVRQQESPEVRAQLINIARLQLQQAQQALAVCRNQEQAAMVLSPVDGVVQLTNYHEGDEVEAGTPILLVGDSNNAWVEGFVDRQWLSQIELGEYVEYAIKDYKNRKFSGTMFEVTEQETTEQAGSPDSTPQPSDVKIKISLPTQEDEYPFKPGMMVDLKLRRN